MRTFADLKRAIRPGVRLRVISHEYRPELTGTVRIVTDVQGNGYFYRTSDEDTRRSWSPYAKARCYSFPAPNTYRHDEGALCSCGHRDDRDKHEHSSGCSITTGKRTAWTIKIESGVA